MKKILITSGGTREYIDDVRVLTNISSGKLGAKIAEKLSEEYEIYYVYAKGSIMPVEYDNVAPYRFCEVTDVASLMIVMEELVPQMDVVIHLMAVSDFGFKSISTKLKSSDPEAFIESMRERIYKNPKVLSHIKEWNPNCFLISFKFEVGLEHEELINIACQSMLTNHSDVVVANDKKEMVDNKKHIAYILEYVKPVDDKISEKFAETLEEQGLQGFTVKRTNVEGKEEIAEMLLEIVKKIK